MIRGTTTPVGVFPVLGFRWGAVTGATAGELLRVRYSGATITAAQLELAGGTVLELGVDVDELSVLLPPDTPAGVATIVATLEDGSTRELELYLNGSIVIPQGPPQGPIGPGRRRRDVETISSPSRVVMRAGTRIGSRGGARDTIVVRSHTRRRFAPPPAARRVVTRTRLEHASATRVHGRRRAGGGVRAMSSSRIGRRDIAPALIALNLL